MRLIKLMIVLMVGVCLRANDADAQTHAPSASVTGIVGLNNVPSARMDDTGTIRFGLSTLDPYLHSFIGMQLWDPVYVQLRQSGEISTLSLQAERLYPGIDMKFRLTKEGRYQPDLVVGFNSAFGHQRFASEYFALSKRYWDIDFTTGVGWGRMAGDGHVRNPLRRISKHFDAPRDFNSDAPNTIHDWFTGPDIGFFAGVEYSTPIDGLSVKADWGAQDFAPEKALTPTYSAPAPWTLALNYNPADWASVSVGVAGADKIFARLSLQGGLMSWPFHFDDPGLPAAVRPHRTSDANPVRMRMAANNDAVPLYDTRIDGTRARAQLDMDGDLPPALQIGRAIRHMANHAGPDVASLEITPRVRGLKGKAVRIVRRDVEAAAAHNNGSPEEIWQDISFIDDPDMTQPKTRPPAPAWAPRLIWDSAVSLSEEDAGYLYRTALIVEETQDLPYGLTLGGSLRWNIADNLHHLADYRIVTGTPVRSDVDLYASRTFAVDRAYVSWMNTLAPDVHVALTAGALEEMYTGVGGEILYRPFGKTFAVGAEAWHVYKRDPASPMTIDMHDINFNTGFLNAWYEVPGTDLTLFAKAGRFLGEDDGISGGMEMHFSSGATLAGFITATERAEPDVFGGDTHLFGGLRLSLPIGGMAYVPNGSAVRVKAGPIGRDSAQELDKPLPLYELTEPMSYRRLSRSWTEVLN